MKTIITLLLSLTIGNLSAQYDYDWQEHYGTELFERPLGLCATDDGGAIFTGYSTYTNKTQITAVRLNKEGSVIWDKTYGGSNREEGFRILKTDGGYVIAGTARSSDGDVETHYGKADLWVFKISLLGDIVWQTTIGGADFEFCGDFTKTNDGGFVIVGTTHSDSHWDNNGGSDVIITKLSSSGEILWNRTFGGTNDEGAWGAVQNDQGDIYVGFNTKSSDGDIDTLYNERDFGLIKLSNIGDLIWLKTYDGKPGRNDLIDIELLSNGSIVMVGRNGERDSWVVCTDADGEYKWDHTYGEIGGDIAYSLIEIESGLIIVGNTSFGTADPELNEESNVMIYQLDHEGTLVWSSHYGGSGHDIAYDIDKGRLGFFILIGSTSTNGSFGDNKGKMDAVVLKISLQETSTIDIKPLEKLSLFPNPSAELITIDIAVKDIGARYQIFSNSGELVLEGTLLDISTTIDVCDLPSASYSFQVTSSNRGITVPFLKF